jgi:hypothetical protein
MFFLDDFVPEGFGATRSLGARARVKLAMVTAIALACSCGSSDSMGNPTTRAQGAETRAARAVLANTGSAVPSLAYAGGKYTCAHRTRERPGSTPRHCRMFINSWSQRRCHATSARFLPNNVPSHRSWSTVAREVPGGPIGSSNRVGPLRSERNAAASFLDAARAFGGGGDGLRARAAKACRGHRLCPRRLGIDSVTAVTFGLGPFIRSHGASKHGRNSDQEWLRSSGSA